MSAYQGFLFAVAFLWLFASDRDRAAARIVLLATLASSLLVQLVTSHIAAPWKLVIPGAVETATIICLLKWARNPTGYAQACFVSVAWLAHLFCYVDLIFGTDLVYTRYETVLWLVNLAQLAAFHDSVIGVLRGAIRWGAAFGTHSVGDVCASGVCHSVSRGQGVSKLH